MCQSQKCYQFFSFIGSFGLIYGFNIDSLVITKLQAHLFTHNPTIPIAGRDDAFL